jgi:Zn-dependent protease with chaperone function
MAPLWKIAAQSLVAAAVPGRIDLDIDDTLFHRPGRKVEGAGLFRDAVRTSGSGIVYARGLSLVVMTLRITWALLVVLLIVDTAHAQGTWSRVPEIAVISGYDDSRLALVDEAVAFWNKTLDDLGSGFRLGPIKRIVRVVPEAALQSLSRSIVASPRAPIDVPEDLRGLPGDLTIVLADSAFVSFAAPFDPDGKRIVGIRGLTSPPMTLPNVARNVIAHELGHAIGLRHNDDPSKLMCGRPASCGPDLFRSSEPRMFPLTEEDRQRLLRMYPPQWKPSPSR